MRILSINRRNPLAVVMLLAALLASLLLVGVSAQQSDAQSTWWATRGSAYASIQTSYGSTIGPRAEVQAAANEDVWRILLRNTSSQEDVILRYWWRAQCNAGLDIIRSGWITIGEGYNALLDSFSTSGNACVVDVRVNGFYSPYGPPLGFEITVQSR